MKVYRYEKPDGGGPFCFFDGSIRSPHLDTLYFQDDELFGCSSLQGLHDYFKGQENLLKNCILKIYDVPDDEVKIKERQVTFPKKYSPYYENNK